MSTMHQYLGLHNLIAFIQLSQSVREEEVSVREKLTLLGPVGCEGEMKFSTGLRDLGVR